MSEESIPPPTPSVEYTPMLKLKNSIVAGRVPDSLEAGELAINNNDSKLFYKDTSEGLVKSFDFKLGLQGLTLQNFLNFEKQLRDYRNSTVADLQTWTIADYSTAIPPYRQQHEYYAFCDYDVDTQTISESENISEVVHNQNGEFTVKFISKFPHNKYKVNFEFAGFEGFGADEIYVSQISSQWAGSMTVRTARVTTTENTETSSWDLAVARDNIPGLKITAYY